MTDRRTEKSHSVAAQISNLSGIHDVEPVLMTPHLQLLLDREEYGKA